MRYSILGFSPRGDQLQEQRQVGPDESVPRAESEANTIRRQGGRRRYTGIVTINRYKSVRKRALTSISQAYWCYQELSCGLYLPILFELSNCYGYM